MERRTFLKLASVGTVSSYLSPSGLMHLLNYSGFSEIGLQLYTVRQEMESDLVKTLNQVKSIGFSHVEGASYANRKFYGLSRQDFLNILEDSGLKMYSNHISFGSPDHKDSYDMLHNWEQVCEDAAFVGQKMIVCPILPKSQRASIDTFKQAAGVLNRCGETAQAHGLKMCYHNHAFEFEPMDGNLPFDILAQETDPSFVHFELDIYWTHKAGMDTTKLIETYAGRFPLFHIKDMADTPDKPFTEVGTGVIDWKQIFKLSQKAGLEYFYVEQDDMIKYAPFESVKISFDHLKSMKF